jgi:hypothetical protein
MKRKATQTICNWGVLLPLLGAVFWLGSAVPASADKLKFTDGTEVEGDILSENDFEVVFQVSFDEGTITATRTYERLGVSEIIRTPPEEKQKQKMEQWHARVMRYQLNTKTSYELDYYDRVIKEVFNQYITLFPDSPHTKMVGDLKAQWQTERDRVAAGNVRRQGQWMTAEESKRLTQEQLAAEYLDNARSKLAAREFRPAWLDVKKGISLTKDPELLKQAAVLQNEAFQRYFEYTTGQEQWLRAQIEAQEKRTGRANAAAAGVESQPTFTQPADLKSPSGDDRVRRSAETQGDAVKGQAARQDEVLTQLKDRLATLQREVAEAREHKKTFDSEQPVGSVTQAGAVGK